MSVLIFGSSNLNKKVTETDQLNNLTITNDWAPLLRDEFKKPYYLKLKDFLHFEYAAKTVFPQKMDILNALHYTPFHKVKVVVLGQDPYHGPGQANGLSFSVQRNIKQPPSLVNIFKELKSDIGCSLPHHGDLSCWAKQGVLLLNTVLTVRNGQAHSHRNKGWETFTDKIIQLLNNKNHPIVYILWGKAAQSKETLIQTEKHYIIKAPHPSPLSAYRGFFGSKPFSKTNTILNKLQLSPIDWDSICD